MASSLPLRSKLGGGGAKSSKPLGVEAWTQPKGVWVGAEGSKAGAQREGWVKVGRARAGQDNPGSGPRSKEGKEGQKS